MYVESKRQHEANTTAELYHQAKLRGWRVELEALFPSRFHRSGRMRVDAAVFVDNKFICVVECKHGGHKPPSPDSRQGQAYAGLGVPVFICLGRRQIKETISRIEDLVHELLAA